MYYDYPEEEFYPESEYQEQIDALKEAIKNSVKSEILEEMNRLRSENEKFQGIKEHFEEVKKDYEKKKGECDRIARNAEYNAKKMRLVDLMKDHKVIKWKITWECVYGPKCDKCDSNREVEVKLPSGKIVKDLCRCSTECDKYTEDRKKEAIESLSDEVRDILFSEENECQKVCDRLNAGLGNFLYKNNGESVKEYIKIEKEDKRGKKVR